MIGTIGEKEFGRYVLVAQVNDDFSFVYFPSMANSTCVVIMFDMYFFKKKKNIYIYILFGPVNPELGVIPSGQKNHSTMNI